MIVTEKQAAEATCPLLGLTMMLGVIAATRGADVEFTNENAGCIGPQCMWWRWEERVYDRDTELWSRSKNKKVSSAWGDDAWWRPVGADADKEPPDAVGYCGMARAPS